MTASAQITCEPTMVKWRDLDSVTIRKCVRRNQPEGKIYSEYELVGLMHKERRSGLGPIYKKTLQHDFEYIYNCA